MIIGQLPGAADAIKATGDNWLAAGLLVVLFALLAGLAGSHAMLMRRVFTLEDTLVEIIKGNTSAMEKTATVLDRCVGVLDRLDRQAIAAAAATGDGPGNGGKPTNDARSFL